MSGVSLGVFFVGIGVFFVGCKPWGGNGVYALGCKPWGVSQGACQTAFHGSNMSCLFSILKRGFLDTGPNGKRANRHGNRRQFGVYCHKHGTRRKAANYMKYFQYPGFIAAPLLELKVRNYIACGDQWCSDPSDVQIESVWIHIAPIRSVRLNRYFIVASPWQNSYELQPRFEAARSRYSTSD